MADVFKTLVVVAADKDAASATGAAAGGGDGMFSVALAPTSEGPATHWGCSGLWPQEVVDAMWPSACDISEDEPPAMMARLGLVMVG